MRRSGILLAISSLPSKYGIGTFSKEAYEFVDFLEQAGQSLWQILPLGPTGYGDSPYQSFSTFAGNPYYIDLEEFIKEGWLTEEECKKATGSEEETVNYERIYKTRFKLLRKAFQNSNCFRDVEYLAFLRENAYWLKDYARYMALKDFNGGKSWLAWKADWKNRSSKAMDAMEISFQEELQFYYFQQYYFHKQWQALKGYANGKGISIVGDIPIYVALDSADSWANREQFQLDEDGTPIAVAGCPPDAFAKTGQLWGNPLYRWEEMKEDGYSWWVKRMQYCFTLYDIVRIDHFRGFDAYYSIPYGDPTAEYGEWKNGPGYDFFASLKKKLGKMPVIAEDLGFLTPSVYKMVKKTGYPGMKVLQFGLYASGDSEYLPHHYEQNCVVYTGTHDNDTTLGWYRSLSRQDRKFTRQYLDAGSEKQISMKCIRAAIASVADTAIIPMQDYLNLGSEARMNVPSTLGENWKWRLKKKQLTEELAENIYSLTKLYGRVQK